MRRQVAAFLVPVASVVAVSAAAAPRWVRLAVPADKAESSEVISWNTDATPDANTVEYGIAQNALNQSANGKSFAAKGKLGIVHEVTLTGLQPDTKYFYRVGGAGDWSPVRSFRTAPKAGCGPVKFIASGDHRSDDTAGPNPKWASILGEMHASGAQFIIETGDLVKDGDDINQWHNHMEMAQAKSGEIALMPSFGNHDTDNVKGATAAYNQIWSLPHNDAANNEDFYCFPYGHAVFCALSTATHNDAAGLAMQAKWLDKELAKHADKTWKFVYFHHPVHTSYIDLKFIDLNHPPNEVKQNEHFVPVFDKHHVDVVFAGHNHFYERFAPMKAGAPVSSTKDGTVYITTGGAGAFTYDEIDVLGFKIEPMKVICADGLLGMSGKAKGSQVCSGKHHFMEIDLNGGEFKAVVRATAAQNFGTADKNKGVIETITINKAFTAPQGCSTPVGPGEDANAGGDVDAGSTSDASGADAGSSADVATSDLQMADTSATPDVATAQDTAAPADSATAPDTAVAVDTATAPDVAAAPDSDSGDDADGADAEVDTGTAAQPDTKTGGTVNDLGGGSLGPLDAGGGTSTATASSKPAGSDNGCSSARNDAKLAGWASVVFAAWLIRRRKAPV